MVSSFLCIVTSQIRVNVGALGKTTLTLGILKVSKYLRRITKTTLAYERTPDLDVFFRQGSPNLETPFENVLVRAALECARNQGPIFDSQKAAAPTIKAIAKPGDVIRWQFASRVQAKLIKHPRKPCHPASGFMSAARKSCHGENVRLPSNVES